MGSHITFRQVSLVLAVLSAAVLASGQAAALGAPAAPATPAGRCGEGRFWSAPLRRCLECSHCAGPGREVTVRPCDGVRDAQCGSIRDLDIDWEWLRDRGVGPSGAGLGKVKGTPGLHERINSLTEAEALLRDELRHMPASQHRAHDKLVDFGDDYILPDHLRQPQPQQPQQQPKKEKKHRRKKVPHPHRPANPRPFGDYDDFADFGASGDAAHVDTDDEDLALASWRRSHHRGRASTTTTSTTSTTTTARPTTAAVNLVEDFIVEKELEEALRPNIDVVATTQTFSTAETLVWDWQAGVLVAAVCACLLFFIVAAAYSCQHALHFKKLKKHLDADMEEISTRLALMAAMGSDNLQDGGSGSSGMTSSSSEKEAFPVRRGDHLRTGRQQNDYCLATMPTKTRV